jgi:acyl carrier protein
MFRKIQTLISDVVKAKRPEDEFVSDANHGLSVEGKVKAIMATVFKLDVNEINEEISADDIDQWTSIEHVDFLVKLQNEFEIDFTDSQIVEMLSYQSVVTNVTAALAAKKGT